MDLLIPIISFILIPLAWWIIPAKLIKTHLNRSSHKRPDWYSAQRCHTCSYFLGDLPTDICPECGHDHSNIRHHTWKHRVLFELTGATSFKPGGRFFRGVLRIGSALAVVLIFFILFAIISTWHNVTGTYLLRAPLHWLVTQGLLITGLLFGLPGGTAIVTVHGYLVARVANPPSQPIAPIRLVVLLIATFLADSFFLLGLTFSPLLGN